MHLVAALAGTDTLNKASLDLHGAAKAGSGASGNINRQTITKGKIMSKSKNTNTETTHQETADKAEVILNGTKK